MVDASSVSRPLKVATSALQSRTAGRTERVRLFTRAGCDKRHASTESKISLLLTTASTSEASWVDMESTPPRSAISSERHAVSALPTLDRWSPRGYRAFSTPV